jgi:hypothetical protein
MRELCQQYRDGKISVYEFTHRLRDIASRKDLPREVYDLLDQSDTLVTGCKILAVEYLKTSGDIAP